MSSHLCHDYKFDNTFLNILINLIQILYNFFTIAAEPFSCGNKQTNKQTGMH